MKTNPKLTPWFTNGEKPVHIGVYNVSCQRENQSGEWYSYWDGSYFSPFAYNVEDAYDFSECSPKYSNEEGSWRGLAEKSEV